MASTHISGAEPAADDIFNLFGEEMVTFEVGTGANMKRFLIHKKLLCSKVSYFDRMFNGSFKEGVEQNATFPEDDIDAWALMVAWIYRDILYPLPLSSTTIEDRHKNKLRLIKALGLAEKYLIDRFADQLTEAIVSYYQQQKIFPGPTSTNIGYLHTGSGSKLRLFLARENAYRLCFKSKEKEWEETYVQEAVEQHQDLGLDMLPIIHEFALEEFSTYRRRYQKCDYHQHGTDEACPYGDDIVGSVEAIISSS